MFQSVADIFHTLLVEIEKADGNVQEKSNCVISWTTLARLFIHCRRFSNFFSSVLLFWSVITDTNLDYKRRSVQVGILICQLIEHCNYFRNCKTKRRKQSNYSDLWLTSVSDLKICSPGIRRNSRGMAWQSYLKLRKLAIPREMISSMHINLIFLTHFWQNTEF